MGAGCRTLVDATHFPSGEISRPIPLPRRIAGEPSVLRTNGIVRSSSFAVFLQHHPLPVPGNAAANRPIEPGKVDVFVLACMATVGFEAAGFVGKQYLPVFADIEQVQSPLNMQQVPQLAVQIDRIECAIDASITAREPDLIPRVRPRQTRKVAPLAGQPPGLARQIDHGDKTACVAGVGVVGVRDRFPSGETATSVILPVLVDDRLTNGILQPIVPGHDGSAPANPRPDSTTQPTRRPIDLAEHRRSRAPPRACHGEKSR